MRFQLTGGKAPPRVMDVSDHFDSGALIIGDIPDYLMVPDQIGGGRANVTDRGWWDHECPNCHAGGPVYTMVTDKEFNGGVIAAVCCSSCEQYSWIRWENEQKRDQKDEAESVRGGEPRTE